METEDEFKKENETNKTTREVETYGNAIERKVFKKLFAEKSDNINVKTK